MKQYQGEFGKLVVDLEARKVIEDTLDRHAIWEAAGEDYASQMEIYSEILNELLGPEPEKVAPPRRPDEIWAGEPTDFGYRAYLEDGSILQVDAEGTYFLE